MQFTFKEYENLINLLRDNGYHIVQYSDCYNSEDRLVILRHDVDLSVEKALSFAKLEHDLGVVSTYFILLSSFWYNIADEHTRKCI